MPRRSTDTGSRGRGHDLPTPGIPASSWSKVYGLGLMLLLVVFVLFAFRGRVPRAVERAFSAAPVDPAVAAARHQEVMGLQGGAWFDPVDSNDFVETPGYRRLLQMLLDHDRPEDLIQDAPEFDYEQALKTPDLQRARVFKLRGVVADLWAHKLDQPVHELTDVWRVFVTEGDAENGVVVDVLERPPHLETRGDQVELQAQFYRLVRYENEKGKMRDVPYFLARTLTVVPEQAKPTVGASLLDPANIVLLLAVAAMFTFAAFRVIRSRRKRPTVRWRAPHLHSSSVPHSEG